jgi:ribonuclease J
MLVKHGRLAVEEGVESDNVFVLDNGDVLQITEKEASIIEHIQAGAVFVDNSGLSDIDPGIFKDRRRLAEHGVAVVQVTCPNVEGHPIKLEYVLKGIAATYDKNALKKDLLRVVGNKMKEKHILGELKRELYAEIGTVLYRTVKKSPTVILLINNFKQKEGFGSKEGNK